MCRIWGSLKLATEGLEAHFPTLARKTSTLQYIPVAPQSASLPGSASLSLGWAAVGSSCWGLSQGICCLGPFPSALWKEGNCAPASCPSSSSSPRENACPSHRAPRCLSLCFPSLTSGMLSPRIQILPACESGLLLRHCWYDMCDIHVLNWIRHDNFMSLILSTVHGWLGGTSWVDPIGLIFLLAFRRAAGIRVCKTTKLSNRVVVSNHTFQDLLDS